MQRTGVSALRLPRGTPVSEELNELIDMTRTIRMTPEQGIPCLERRETWGTRGAALPTATRKVPRLPLGMTDWEETAGDRARDVSHLRGLAVPQGNHSGTANSIWLLFLC